MEFQAFPMVLYHPVHGERVVMDQEDKDTLLAKGWSESQVDPSRKGQIISQIKCLRADLDELEDELKEIIAIEKEAKKALEPPKFDADGHLLINVKGKNQCMVKNCKEDIFKEELCKKHYDEALNQGSSDWPELPDPNTVKAYKE